MKPRLQLALGQGTYAGIVALLILGIVCGWAASRADPSSGEFSPPSYQSSMAAAALDGMTFQADMGPTDKPADVHDQLIFADGMFQSVECARRCGYPPSAYYVREVGDAIEFMTESVCEEQDATMIWKGTVEDGVIRGRVRWSAERWYWTVENDFWFEGKLVGNLNVVDGRR